MRAVAAPAQRAPTMTASYRGCRGVWVLIASLLASSRASCPASVDVVGQVPSVVFPSGLVVESMDEEGFALPDSRVFVYYGAADTCVGLATARVQGLIEQAKFR